jgi:hypothetical protein
MQVLQVIQKFHRYDDLSRVLPKTKDFTSVRDENNDKHLQKCNFREAFAVFKEKYSNLKIADLHKIFSNQKNVFLLAHNISVNFAQ